MILSTSKLVDITVISVLKDGLYVIKKWGVGG